MSRNTRIKRKKRKHISDKELNTRQANSLIIAEKKAIEKIYPFSLEEGVDDSMYAITKTKLDNFFYCIELGSSYEVACNYSGISRHFFYDFINKGKQDILQEIETPYAQFYQLLLKKEAEYEIKLLEDVNILLEKRDNYVTKLLQFLSSKYPKKWAKGS